RDERREHRFVFRGDVRGPLAERERRVVDALPDVSERDELLRANHVAALDGGTERFDVAFLQRRHELRPRVESCLSRYGELRIGELERSRGSAGIGANRTETRERRRVTVTRVANQIFGELALLFEIGHGRPPSNAPVSASWAEER